MPFGAAIIGTGFVGTVHARAVRAAGGTVAGVAASTPERSREAAAQLGAARAYERAEAALGDPGVDVVCICTPNHLHEDLAAAALAAGRHVVCEKPLALDAAGARRLADAAAAAPGLVAAVPFAYRFHPAVREARHRIASGASGPVHLIHGTYLQDWLLEAGDDDWRVDARLGGASRAFADIGSHFCDLAEFVTGHRIARISARTVHRHPERGTEDGATFLLETAEGALGSGVVSQVSAGRKNRLWIEVDAAHESLTFDQEHPDALRVGRRASTEIVPRDPLTMSPDAARLAFVPAGHPQGYQDCFQLFYRDVFAAMRGERPEGLPGFPAGLRAAQVTDAAMRSAREQRWVDVPA